MNQTPGSQRHANPLLLLLDAIGSIWFGMAVLVAIFLYSSIGSAAPPIRQGAMADWLGLELLRFEKTEMEWFCWWPFQWLIILFCVAMIIGTIRRIPLNLPNLGVWLIHTGIVVLAVSSMVYFGLKIEGDVPIFHARALVLAPGMTEPVSMVVRPDAIVEVPAPGGGYRLRVTQIIPNYEVLTGDHRGRRTQAIWFNVESMQPRRSFIRIVLRDFPEYTEDVLDGEQGARRAVKVSGQRLIDEGLQIRLDYDPVNMFYESDAPALYARVQPEREWTQIRLSGLPRYFEHVANRDELWPTPGMGTPAVRPLDVVSAEPEGPALGNVRLRVTDFLPYAGLEPRWVDGGPDASLNPVLRVRIASGRGDVIRELSAFEPQDVSDDLNARFVWAATPQQRESLLNPAQPRLVVRADGAEHTIELSKFSGSARVPVPGTEYQLELVEQITPGSSGTPAIAWVRVHKGELTFNRVVLAGDDTGGRDIDEKFVPLTQPADPGFKLEYVAPATGGLLFVSGPDTRQLELLTTASSGGPRRQQVTPGAAIDLEGGQRVTVEAFIERARQDVRPMIVPPAERQPLQQVGKGHSLIRVEVRDGANRRAVWLPFNFYAFRDAQRAQPSRFTYMPRMMSLADGRVLELMYSRARRPLPSPVALDRFVLQTYPGGDRPSDYISLIRFHESGSWSPLIEVKSNRPARHADYWYFQSQWDPGTEAHTVLGVGNRRAVGTMLAGVCISIAGMIYAFYIKPAIVRRRKNPLADQPGTAAPRAAELSAPPAGLNR